MLLGFVVVALCWCQWVHAGEGRIVETHLEKTRTTQSYRALLEEALDGLEVWLDGEDVGCFAFGEAERADAAVVRYVNVLRVRGAKPHEAKHAVLAVQRFYPTVGVLKLLASAVLVA